MSTSRPSGRVEQEEGDVREGVDGGGWRGRGVCGGVAFTELFTELCEASH